MSLRVFISYRFLFAAAFRFLFDEHHAGVEAGNDDGGLSGGFCRSKHLVQGGGQYWNEIDRES